MGKVSLWASIRVWVAKTVLRFLIKFAPLFDWMLAPYLQVILERRCEPSRLRRAALRIAGGEEVYHVPIATIDMRLRERVKEVSRVRIPTREGTLRMGIVAIIALERRLIRQLVVDLQVTRQPAKQIKNPIFIVGPPRSGTTLLLELLGQEFRQLLTYEAIGLNYSWLAGVQYAMDAVRHIHHERWDGPTECRTALENSGAPYIFWYTFGVPFVGPTLEDYEFYSRQLGVLDADATWLLKDPAHSLHELFTVFPDARVIMTHRHPSKVAASMCSLALNLWRLLLTLDVVEKGEIWKDLVVEPLADMLDKNLDYRDLHPDAKIFDVHMDDLVSDPLAMVARIFHFLGRQPPDYAPMQHFLHTSKPGTHSYSLADFGLDQAYIEARFQRYITFLSTP